MSDDAVYADDGTYLGEMYEAEDGARVLVDETGDVIAAVDETGAPLDPASYTLDVGDDLADVDDLRAELDELRADIENTPEYEPGEAYAAGAAASGAQADESWAHAMQRQLEHVQSAIGRPLTESEAWRVMEEAYDDFESGVGGELIDQVARAGIVQFAPGADAGPAHDEARRAYMAQLLEDGERTARGENPGAPPPRMAEEYDTSTAAGDRGHGARVALAMDTIHGHDTEDRTYDSSQPIEED